MTVALPHFAPRIDQYLPAEQLLQSEAEVGSVVALWPDLTIAYTNPAWYRFAVDNDGEPSISQRWSLGACVLDAIYPEVRPFFAKHYRRCLYERAIWHYDYECSSADRYRIFHMKVQPTREAEALIVIHSPRIDFACMREAQPPSRCLYRQLDGTLRQCCDCRKFQRADALQLWDWVPEWICHRPLHVCQTICSSCRRFYAGDD